MRIKMKVTDLSSYVKGKKRKLKKTMKEKKRKSINLNFKNCTIYKSALPSAPPNEDLSYKDEVKNEK